MSEDARLAPVRPRLLALLATLLLLAAGCDHDRENGRSRGPFGLDLPIPTFGLGGSKIGEQAAGRERAIPLQVIEGPEGSVLALVPVFVQGQGPYAFALDTGASRSVVGQQIADELQLGEAGNPGTVVGVFGTGEAGMVRVQQWRAGDVELPATTVVTIDLSAAGEGQGPQGLLGSDLLSRYGAVTVDYERGLLILRDRLPAAVDPSPSPTGG